MPFKTPVEGVVESAPTNEEVVVEEVAESTPAELAEEEIATAAIEEPLSEEGELSTEEEKVIPSVQKRIDQFAREKNEAKAKLAHAENTNKYLLQEVSTLKQAKAPAEKPAPQEPQFEAYEEKYSDDPEKATREFLKDHAAYTVKSTMANQSQEAARTTEAQRKATQSADFQSGSYAPEVMKKYPDFHAVVYSPAVQMTATIKDLVESSPQKFALAYKLASNPDTLNRLNSSSVAMAAKEIGVMEHMFSSPLQKKVKSKAPKGITPVGKDAGAVQQSETDMPIDQFLAREHKKINASNGF